MADPNFAHTLTYVCEHNKDGRARHRRQQADRHDAVDAVRADRACRLSERSAARRARALRRARAGRPRLRAAPAARQLAVDARDQRRPRTDDVEGRARGGRPRRRAGATCWCRSATPAGRPASSSRSSAQNAWLTVEADADLLFELPAEERLSGGDAAARHRLLAPVRGRRARVTRDRCTRVRHRAHHRARVRFRHPTHRGRRGQHAHAQRAAARPRSTTAAPEPRFAAIAALVDEWQPGVLVVGIPVHADGTAHAMTARARRFARRARRRVSAVPVEHADERYTTQLAQAAISTPQDAGRAGRDARDAVCRASHPAGMARCPLPAEPAGRRSDARRARRAHARRRRARCRLRGHLLRRRVARGAARPRWCPATIRSASSTSRSTATTTARTGLKPAPSAPNCRSTSTARRSCSSTTCSITGRSVRAAINELFDFGRPATHRARRADRPRRPRAADRADLLRRAAGRRARTVDRAVARRRSASCSRSSRSAERPRPPDAQSAAQRERRAHASADARGPAGRRHPPHPRYRRAVRLDRRARGQEGAAAARQGGLQPVLRELDAHADDVRDRGQATVGRRDQPQHRRIVDDQGRDAARHRRQPGGDGRGHVRRAPCAVGRAASSSRASQRAPAHARARGQRRRRPARASDAGPARPVHDPPLQEGLPQPDRGHRRRRAALARRALADPRPDDARHARRARHRPARRCSRRRSTRWACASSTTCARVCAAATSS